MLSALVLVLAASGASAARIKWAGSQGPSAGFLAVNGGDLQNDGKAITYATPHAALTAARRTTAG